MDEFTAGLRGRTADRVAAEIPDIAALAKTAAELTPILAARAAEGEQNRRIADDLIEEVAARGLFKVTLPVEHGGYGHTAAASVAVTEQIARGDGATSWIVMNIHAGMWIAGVASEQARDDIWGADPEARVCTVTAPRGKGRKVPGGRVLNGLWPFASGCLHAQWAALGVLLVDDKDEMEGLGLALVPISDLVMRDDWDVSGFRGTGSNTLELKEVFVPDHRMPEFFELVDGRAVYEKAPSSSVYYGASLSSLFAVVVFGPIIGMGEAACDAFIASVSGREVAYSMGAQQADSQIIQLHLAQARMALQSARLLAADCNTKLDQYARSPDVLPGDIRAYVRAAVAYAARLVLESVQLLMADSGGRGLSGPLPQILRDLQALNNHGIVNVFQTLGAYGAYLLERPSAVVFR